MFSNFSHSSEGLLHREGWVVLHDERINSETVTVRWTSTYTHHSMIENSVHNI